MRKSLRSLAIVALSALPFAASAELTITPVWVNGVENGVSNPIPDVDGGWGKPTASNPGDKTVCRFAVGKDGKLLMNNHKENAIMAWDGKAMTTYAKLPAVTVTDWSGNETAPNSKWNGTAITTDDAGNVIYDYCFINADKSLQYWGVVAADGTITDVELSTPLADLGTHGRLDILGHIVGDVNSTKGGIGYATTPSSNNVIMFHFKGDGKKVTSLTAKSFEVADLASNGLYVPSPKYLTVDELMANGTPEKEFYVAYGALNSETLLAGTLASGDETLTGFGNRQYNTSAVFALAGKKYIVRTYVSPENPKADVLTGWKGVMTFGIYDLASGKLVASWQGSEYSNAYGMGTITAEPVDDNTVNVYMFVCTGSPDAATGTTPGGYGGMFKVTTSDVVVDEPDGSKEKPYLIATAEDLCNAWKKTVTGKLVYFKQTANIDMAGVTDYTALVGFDSDYNKSIYYDGDYHVIYNFAPVDRIAGQGANAYYDTSLFGTPSGTIKNLGVVNAKIETEWFEAGILGGFAGVSQTASAEMNIDNVFVTGTIKGGANTIAGGMFGTSKQPLNITNSYVQVEINGQTYSAGFICKAGAATKVSNSYASATVTGTTTALAVATDPAAPAAITFDNVVAFGTGNACNVATTGSATVVPALDANGIATVQGWDAFNQKELFQGLPALNWQANIGAGFADAVVDSNDAPAVYYNLQGVQVANPDNGIYIVRRGNKVTKELIRK